MVLKKVESEFGYDINLKVEEGTFKIYYGGNLDLYWTFWPNDFNLEACKYPLLISKDDEVYSIFELLYDDIMTCNFSSHHKQRLKTTDEYALLCQDETICWHSDEQVYEDANCVFISKQENGIFIEFDFKNVDMNLENSIRFRNSGSRYTPFNQVFMKHFQSLCEMESKTPEGPKVKVK